MNVYLVVYGTGLTYSVHGVFLDETAAITKCRKEARNHYDPDNWRVLEEELIDKIPSAQDVPREAIAKILTEVMDIAVSSGADSRSMPDEYVEVAAWLCGIPAHHGTGE